MANFKLDQDSLLQTLQDLLSHKSSDSVSFGKFECKDGYAIHHIPANFQHPLKDIVNTVENSFLLVSKPPQPSTTTHNESTDSDDMEHSTIDHDVPILPIITHHHVYVGTPISQKVYYLFQQRDLHSQEATKVEKSIDISCLEKLNLKYARYFLSLYIQCHHILKDLPEIWLLCDQENHQGVTFLGMVPDFTKSENSATPVNTVLIRNKDVDHNKEDELKKKHNEINEEKKKHMAFNRASHAETHGYAKYHIYGASNQMVKDGDRPESTITMEFAWDGVSKILQRPPPSSNAVLSICAQPEDVQGILLGISSELRSLVGHFAAVQKKLSGHDDDNEEDGEEIDNEKVMQFLDDLKHNSFVTTEALRTNSVDESPAGNMVSPSGIGEALQRQDLDNTEFLWLFLKDFTSQPKILFYLNAIFSALFEGEYHPILHATNQTVIAKLMKEVYCCKTNIEKAGVKAKISNAFDTCTPLHCVVDIGLEKLRNDYTNYFIKQELVTKDKLEYYLDQDISMSDKIQRLLKFHCILSLVALSISYAHVNFDGLRKLVSSALKFYENHSHTEHPIFSLSLPAFSASSSNIKNVCIQQFQPQTWVVAITTMNEYITVIQVEASNHLQESFDHDKSFQNSYVATTATVSQICI